MAKNIIAMEELLGLLNESQRELVHSKSRNVQENFDIKLDQQRLLGETLTKAKSRKLSREIRESLWSKMENEQQSLEGENCASSNSSSKVKYQRETLLFRRLSISLAACLVIALISIGMIKTANDGPTTTFAVLTSEFNNASWYVNISQNYITLIPVRTYQKSIKSDLQLWAITADKKIISLGVIPDKNTLKLELKSVKHLTQSDIRSIAISIEKSGGSHSNQPEGKVIYASDVQILTASGNYSA